MIVYHSGWNEFIFPVLTWDIVQKHREIVTLSAQYNQCLWYDDWLQNYSRDTEIHFIEELLDSLSKKPRLIHMAWISCEESITLIAQYYTKLWYHNSDTHQYEIPFDTPLTMSVSLRHILWCEKDKTFLSCIDSQNFPHYAVCPPLRSPGDLRSLQQWARQGLLVGVSCGHGDEKYLQEILMRHILTPFQLSQLVFYRWKNFWFVWCETLFSLSLPIFSDPN